MKAMAANAVQPLELLRSGAARLVSIFGGMTSESTRELRYILDFDGEYRVFGVRVDGPVMAATAITPAASWYEREVHERYGIDFEGHPDLRPLTQHTPDYRFLKVAGDGVCEVAVGPVHAGIIEPGHFRFSVVGDTVLHLELRHFYTHKGTERLFEGSDPNLGVMIAESVSGDSCFSHAVAYCQAVEHATRAVVPERAGAIRLVGQELERVIAHIGDVGALCGDVGFSVPAAYCSRLKENLLRSSADAFGTRYLRGISVPGGITRDIAAPSARALRQAVRSVTKDFADLAQMILETPSVQNRFESTGVLKPESARDLAVVGPVARASSIKLDVRHDHPYGAYKNWLFEPVTYHYGDVLSRARVRIDETAASALLLEDVLDALPAGACTGSMVVPEDATGFSAVESPRGELLYWVEVRRGTIARCHIKSPSFQNWPALPLAMPGNIIADFPLINKSFNLSYSGCDR
jgi:Ni,Fe-hydrogenase III large subunit